jgi:transposase
MQMKMQVENKQLLPTWNGIDVAKATFDSAIYMPVEPGQAPRDIMSLPKKTFARTLEGVRQFHDWSFQVRDKAGLKGGNMRIVMEATGRYSKELACWLNAEMPFTRPVIEDPKAVKDFIRSLKLRNKTDQIDAGALARYGAERMPEPTEEMPKDYQYLRELVRQRAAFSDQLTAARARLTEAGEFKEIKKLQQSVIKSLEKAMEKIELQIKRCMNDSDELRRSLKYAVTVPGVALIVTAAVLGECGPLHRHSSRQLGSYSGLSPQIRQSGTSVASSRISKRGSKYLRRVLYMASIAAIEYNPEIAAFHNRLIAKGKKPMQARCAVMRKLLILIRAVVVNEKEYDKIFAKKCLLKT